MWTPGGQGRNEGSQPHSAVSGKAQVSRMGFQPGPWRSECSSFTRELGEAKRRRFEFRVSKIIPRASSAEIAEMHPAGFANTGEDNID
jgi:hypothetical protein